MNKVKGQTESTQRFLFSMEANANTVVSHTQRKSDQLMM